MKLFNERLTQEQQETLLWMIKNLNRNTFAPHRMYYGQYNYHEDAAFNAGAMMNYVSYTLTLFGQLGNKKHEDLIIEKINEVIEKIKTDKDFKNRLQELKGYSGWGIDDGIQKGADEDFFNPDYIEEGDEEKVTKYKQLCQQRLEEEYKRQKDK